MRSHWLRHALTLGLPTIIAWALYAPALRLPFFWDDFPQFAFATSKSYWQLWTDATGLPYYRPLTFTLNKLFFSRFAFGDTFWPHVFVLLGLVLAAALAGYVAGVLYAGPRGAPENARLAVSVLAACLFAAFPFATLSVTYFSGANHIWLATLTLGGLAAGLYYLRSGRRLALAAALAAALLAPTVHEAGVIAGPVIAAGLWVYDRSLLRRRWWLLLALFIASAAFLPIWSAVPKSRDQNSAALALGGPAEILAKLSFFWQAPSYPFQPLAALLMQRLGAWDVAAIWLCGLPPAALAAGWLWRRGQGRVVGVAALWTGLTMLPSVAALHFDYIATSQRLLLYPGAMAGALWAVALVELARAGQGRWPRLAGALLAGGLALATLAVPLAYDVRETQLNVLALTPLEQMDVAARAHPDEQHLIINTVNWLSYRQAWYPIGHDGVTVLAPYLNFLDLVYLNTGVHLKATVATFPDLLPSLSDHFISTANEGRDQLWDTAVFGAHIVGVDHAWLSQYTDAQASVQDMGHVSPGSAQPPDHFLARFGDSVYLLNGSFSAAGGALEVALDWLYLGPDPQATIFRNAFDCEGHVAGLGSGRALGAMLDWAGLPAGTRVRDLRAIALDAPAADGCYQVQVGLFRADGTRLPVTDADGQALPNDLVLLTR